MEEQELQQEALTQDTLAANVPPAADEVVSTSVMEEDEGGVIQISDNVLRLIVRKFTLGVDGVVRFQNQSLMDGMFDILGKRSGDHGIVITLKEDGSADITVSVVMRFGVSIPELAHTVQSVLREKIEQLAGYSVSHVNVNVIDLEEVSEPEPEEKKPEPAPAEPAPAESAPAEPESVPQEEAAEERPAESGSGE